jgi:hypothetical protein
MSIAYTIGRKSCYDRDIEENPGPHYKVGCRDDYEGGWVFPTREAAQGFIETTQVWPWVPKVYGLKLQGDWDSDVSPEPHPEDGVHRLLVDAELFQLERM